MRKDPRQLTLDFPEYRPEVLKAANQAAILAVMKERYPITEAERQILPPGVRLARFVPWGECITCPLAPADHTQDGHFNTLVCLKDLRKLTEGKETE